MPYLCVGEGVPEVGWAYHPCGVTGQLHSLIPGISSSTTVLVLPEEEERVLEPVVELATCNIPSSV
jgi:hypothetical protein